MEQLKQLTETIFEIIYKLSHFLTEAIANYYPQNDLLPQFDFITTYFATTYLLEALILLILLSLFFLLFKPLLNYLINSLFKYECYIIDWENQEILQTNLKQNDFKFLNAKFKKTPISIYKKHDMLNYNFIELIEIH